MSKAITEQIQARLYREEDEAQVLDLLKVTLGDGPVGERSARFFRWKHVSNPFGHSLMLVAELDGRIVGLRAFMRWQFLTGPTVVRAVNAVDTATHPDFQGKGIFSRLTLRALEILGSDADLVFNTPNEKSLPGYLKMGWRRVGRVPVSVRVRRPIRFLRRLSSLRQAGEAMDATLQPRARLAGDVLTEQGDAIAQLLQEDDQRERRLKTKRDLDFLRWRYVSVPRLRYYAIPYQGGAKLRGLAIFRLRPRGRLREATVTDLLVRPGDTGAARKLLGEVIRSVPIDHLTCHFAGGTAQAWAAARTGFVRSPNGITLAVNALRKGLDPDPTTLRSWAFSLGDLEVF